MNKSKCFQTPRANPSHVKYCFKRTIDVLLEANKFFGSIDPTVMPPGTADEIARSLAALFVQVEQASKAATPYAKKVGRSQEEKALMLAAREAAKEQRAAERAAAKEAKLQAAQAAKVAREAAKVAAAAAKKLAKEAAEAAE